MESSVPTDYSGQYGYNPQPNQGGYNPQGGYPPHGGSPYPGGYPPSVGGPQTPPGPPVRPQKATIVGLIFIILALYSIVMAVAMTIMASSLLGSLGGGISVILWVCIAPFILLYILAGYGILQGKHWGWVLGVVFGLLGILGGISSLAQGNYYSVISLLLSIIVVYLLFQDEVKEWCGE